MYMCQSWNDVVVTSTYIQVSFNISPGPTQYVLMLHTGIYVDIGPVQCMSVSECHSWNDDCIVVCTRLSSPCWSRTDTATPAVDRLW